MTTSDDLSAAEADTRKQRERATAVTAALAELLRSGGALPAGGLKRWAEQRLDGTAMTLREHGPGPGRLGTNHNNHVTHAATPIESTREDH